MIVRSFKSPAFYKSPAIVLNPLSEIPAFIVNDLNFSFYSCKSFKNSTSDRTHDNTLFLDACVNKTVAYLPERESSLIGGECPSNESTCFAQNAHIAGLIMLLYLARVIKVDNILL